MSNDLVDLIIEEPAWTEALPGLEALAGTAARGLELLKQFREAVDAVKDNIDDVQELGDVPQAVEGVLEAFSNLKEKLEAIGEDGS